MPGDLPRDLDHLAHTEALPVAQVVDQRAGIPARTAERLEGEQVRHRQIADVDVVADAGAVRRGVVGAKNVHVFRAAEGDLQNPADQMRLRLVRFPLVWTVRARSIEITSAS